MKAEQKKAEQLKTVPKKSEVGWSIGECVRLALLVGVAGGIFEAVILLPMFGFVTLTMGPDIVFIIANVFMIRRSNEAISLGVGIFGTLIGVIVTTVVSFIVFAILFFIYANFFHV